MKNKKRKVSPLLPGEDTSSPHPLVEMNSNIKTQENFEETNPWGLLLNKSKAVSKWLDLKSKRRSAISKTNSSDNQVVSEDKYYENLNSTLNGICSEGEDSDSENEETLNRKRKASPRNLAKSSNKTLIIYFSKLARSQQAGDELDLDFIESLVQNGADINTTDLYGQTVFHEVARTWHTDVVIFLLSLKANINQADKFGRTPLHIAAAVNYSGMIKMLAKNGANLKAKTYGEDQTPVHYAAKNDALDSLRELLKLGCDKEARDFKNRTPLHVASELDRSETALYLVEVGAQVGVKDSSGQTTLALMIEKMPPVASKALNSYHNTDRPNRKQYFFLNLLEPCLPGQFDTMAKTPMQAIIQHKQMNLLLHPVLRRLIKVKWKQFARFGHFKQLFILLCFVAIWSVFGLTTPLASLSEYNKPFKAIWWRVMIEGLAVMMTLWMVLIEIYEWRCSVKYHHKWQEWRATELEKDLNFCHPRWPEEQKYINQELIRITNSKISYFSDFWNVMDWITYFWIMGGMIARVFALNGNVSADIYHRRLLAISMIIIWVRTLKLIRAFQLLGPFIVMLGDILIDTIKFLSLFLHFFIPFVFAFWIIFGGEGHAQLMRAQAVSPLGWETTSELIYSVFLVIVVGDINFDALLSIDKPMARILVSTCIAICGILLLNLFIALMSNTFQRVYDNAQANALMEKAIAINARQLSLGSRSRNRFRLYIHGKCAPEEVYYDDDDNEGSGELERMTIQIKQVVDEIQENIEENILPKINNENGLFNDTISNSSKQRNKELENFIEKQNIDMKIMNDKIDRLTGLITFLVDKNGEKQSIEDSNKINDSKLVRLPSIFDLKPDLFPRGESAT